MQVIAEAIWLAVKHGKADTVVSGTAATFSLACRISPTLIAWCMGKLKFECQATRDQIAYDLLEPTVHVASERALGARGPFGAYARNWSAHVWIKAGLASLFRFLAASRYRPPLSDAALPPTLAPQTPDQEQADLALRFGDS